MIKWRNAFWCCLAILIIMTLFFAYRTFDQAITIEHQSIGYKDTANDLDQLINIINNTDLTINEVANELKDHRNYEFMEFNSDTVSLNRIILIFDGRKLTKVEKKW